jgi:hypothetical protein
LLASHVILDSAERLARSSAEFGVITAKGISHVEELVERAATADLLAMVQATLGVLLARLRPLDATIDELERATVADHRRDPVSRLAGSVPGVGALAAFGDSGQRARSARLQIRSRFRRLAWRDAQAELDGGQREFGSITKQGNRYIRRLLMLGRHLGLAGGAKAQGRVVRLAGRAHSAQTDQDRGRGIGQLARIVQGDHHHRRGLPHLHLRQGLIPTGGNALERRTQAQEFGERDDDVMKDTARRSKTIGHDPMGREPKARLLDWERGVLGLDQGQRSAPTARTNDGRPPAVHG